MIPVAPSRRPCAECGRLMPTDGDDALPSPPRWCSPSCADRATASEPGWIRVEDMTAEQRAELDAIIAPPEKRDRA